MSATPASHPLCPTCGAKLAPTVPPERCPACLLRLALQPADDEPVGPADIDADALPQAPGVFGEYELIEMRGRGAMGAVFTARQPSLDRLVALKILALAGHGPSDAVRRFRAEAAAAAALRHPGIVTIHDVGVYRDRHFIAMDLIEGPTLAEQVASRPMLATEAARIMSLVADAVQCAHESGILHRDLKPSNILIDAAGQPRVADFGLAKRMATDADLTIPGQVMGSPNYMSPEQARGAALGPASDVHALGAVLYHCLTGRPPFVGQTVADTLHQVIHGEPVAPRLLVAGVPRDLETIALKCLEKDPSRRYPSARALVDELGRFLRHEPIQARPVGAPERAWRWCRRRPAVASLAGAASLLLLAVAIGSPIAALRIRAERERAEDNLYAADMHLAQQALARNSRGQVRDLLDRHRPAPGAVDRRGFEWRYLWTNSESDERELLRILGGWRHLVALPGTSQLAAGNAVWDIEEPAQPVFTFPADSVALALDPTTGRLVVGGWKGLTLWSPGSWLQRDLLAGEPVHVAAFSADGRWMATGGAMLRLWSRDNDTWQPVATRARVFKNWHNAQTLAFSPDGRTLVSGTGESWANHCLLEAWSLPALEAQPALANAPQDIVSLAFSPDGNRLLAGCWNGRIRVWDWSTRREIDNAMRHHGFVGDLRFSPADPDVFATAASDRTLRLWSLRTGTELVALQGPLDQLWAMTFAPDGRTLMTLEQGGRIARWDPDTRRHQQRLISGGPRTQLLGFSADGKTLATFDETGALRFWDMARRRELEARRRMFDLTGVFTRDFEITAPVISRDQSRLALPMLDGTMQLWELADGKAHTWKAHGQRVRNAVFSAAGDALATVADDGILKVWDAGSRALRFELGVPGVLPEHDFNVPLVWTSDGRMIAVASADHILIYDGATGRLLRTLNPEGLVYSMRFTADDRLLVSGQEDFDVNFWDPRDGTLVDSVASSHQEGIYEFCFSPDGRTLVSMVDQVKLWSLATRQEVSTLRGHERNIFTGLFSPDGNLLVTGDYGGAVWLWTARPFAETDADGR